MSVAFLSVKCSLLLSWSVMALSFTGHTSPLDEGLSQRILLISGFIIGLINTSLVFSKMKEEKFPWLHLPGVFVLSGWGLYFFNGFLFLRSQGEITPWLQKPELTLISGIAVLIFSFYVYATRKTSEQFEERTSSI